MHAKAEIPAHRRDQLERLIRYTGRGAVSLERLEEDANGELLYRFTRPWSDGTTGIELSPLELLERLSAPVPLPRARLVRYGGCLAPHRNLRAAPFCRRGSLRIIAAVTHESVISRILRHLKLASVPPPIAPARLRQERFALA